MQGRGAPKQTHHLESASKPTDVVFISVHTLLCVSKKTGRVCEPSVGDAWTFRCFLVLMGEGSALS